MWRRATIASRKGKERFLFPRRLRPLFPFSFLHATKSFCSVSTSFSMVSRLFFPESFQFIDFAVSLLEFRKILRETFCFPSSKKREFDTIAFEESSFSFVSLVSRLLEPLKPTRGSSLRHRLIGWIGMDTQLLPFRETICIFERGISKEFHKITHLVWYYPFT